MRSSKKHNLAYLLLFFLCSLAVAAPLDICAAGLYEPEGEIIIKGKKPADFDHRKHRLAGISCAACHHDADHQPLAADDIEALPDKAMLSCLGCHKDEKFENRDKPLKQEIFHGLCRECHLSIIDAKKGPTKCGGCHVVDGMEEEKESASPLEEEYSEQNSNLCLACHNHQQKYDDGMMLQHLHRPFAEKQCRKCHIPEAQDANNGIVALGSEKGTKEKSKTKVRWLSRDYMPTKTHWFVIPAENIDKGLVVVGGSNASAKNTFRANYSMPQINKLKKLKNDETPPKISNVEVLAVNHGLTTSAVIGWETDELSSSLIRYRLGDQELTSNLNDQKVRLHEMTISNLKPNRTYQFSVVSQDIFGNQQISQAFSLSTEKAFSNIEEKDAKESEKPKTTLVKKELFRHNDNYLIKITANQPMTIFVGTNVPPRKKYESRSRKAKKQLTDNGDMDIRRKAKPEIPDAHWVLRTKAETGIDLCVSCHLGFIERTMHPVGIMPSEKIILPDEYPSLPDGRIACLSCHDPHASPYRKLLRRGSKKEVCLGCHRDKKGKVPGE